MHDSVVSIEELSDNDLLYELSKIIECDSDGDYFICKENKQILDELFRRTKHLKEK